MGEPCAHGSTTNVCRRCDCEAELARLRAANARLREECDAWRKAYDEETIVVDHDDRDQRYSMDCHARFQSLVGPFVESVCDKDGR
jgi:hypothetical protein